jgi:hypothetical protein
MLSPTLRTILDAQLDLALIQGLARFQTTRIALMMHGLQLTKTLCSTLKKCALLYHQSKASRGPSCTLTPADRVGKTPTRRKLLLAQQMNLPRVPLLL